MSVTDSTSTTTTTTTQTVYTSTANADSSIDWDALIEASVLQKQLPATNIEVKIAENEVEIAAYEEMQSLMQGMTDALETIRGTDNSLIQSDDVFSQREAYLTGYGNVTADAAVVVTAEDGADTATYELQVLQLAQSHKIASSTQASNGTGLGLSGTFTLELDGMDHGDGGPAEITVDADMSLAEIAEEINANTSSTNVSASVIQVSDTEFTLVLNATETGQSIVMTQTSGDDIGQSLGLTDSAGDPANELQAAQDAIISLDGVQITRDSNAIDDVIDGVTFSIYQETSGDDYIEVEVAQSLTAVQSGVYALVEAYNAYRDWAVTQQEVSSAGGASDDAVLFGDSILRAANSAVADALATVINNESMALLGLSYDESNNLEIDETALADALLTDIDAIEDLMLFQSDISSSDLALLARNSNMPGSLSLDIQVNGDGDVTSVSVDGDDSQFTVDGYRIIGAEGSEYEGISFVFTGSASQTVTMTFSSGLAENLFNALDTYSNETTGLLTETILDLSDQNIDYQEEYDDIISDVEFYRASLVELYAAYQTEISQAEADLEYLSALLDSGD